jgi:CheY-like chemotaxis protein
VTAPPTASEAEPLLVLIIDDVQDNCGMYAQYLGAHGVTVVCAYDGEQGLAMAKASQPDVIVLDLGLPKIDGWEVARRLRAHPAMKEVTIVACTAHADLESRDRALDAGVDSVLVKPCPPDELLKKIRSLRERG